MISVVYGLGGPGLNHSIKTNIVLYCKRIRTDMVYIRYETDHILDQAIETVEKFPLAAGLTANRLSLI